MKKLYILNRLLIANLKGNGYDRCTITRTAWRYRKIPTTITALQRTELSAPEYEAGILVSTRRLFMKMRFILLCGLTY
jgi:hypothetical protein